MAKRRSPKVMNINSVMPLPNGMPATLEFEKVKDNAGLDAKLEVRVIDGMDAKTVLHTKSFKLEDFLLLAIGFAKISRK